MDEHKITDPQRIAELFNDYYADMVKPQTSTTGNNIPHLNHSTCTYNSPKSFFLSPTSPLDIYTIMKTLKNTKSTGFDDICVLVIKSVSHIIAPILSHVINMCFEQGIFPSVLKTTIIKPLHKKDVKSDIKNYRP